MRSVSVEMDLFLEEMDQNLEELLFEEHCQIWKEFGRIWKSGSDFGIMVQAKATDQILEEWINFQTAN